MTLKDLAGDRVTAGQLSFVELGKSNPSTELLHYIAKRLGVSVDYLLESEEAQATRICQYRIRLAQAYIYDHKYEDAEILLQECREDSEKYNLTVLLGSIEYNNGRIAMNTGNYGKAMEYFLKSNKLFLECHDYSGAVDSYILLGETSCKAKSYDIALGYFRQAELLLKDKELQDDKLMARIDFSICTCSVKLGHTDDVDKYLIRVEKYLDTIDDKSEYAHSLMEISIIYKDAQNYDKALQYSSRAVDLFKDIEDDEHQTKIEMDMGMIYSEKGDIEKSNCYLKRCIDSNHHLEDSELSQVYLMIASNYIKQGKYNDAITCVEDSFRIAVEGKDTDCQLSCYSCLLKIYSLEKNFEKYEGLLKSKLSLLESMEDREKLTQCLIEAGKFYNSIGDKNRALEYMEKVL